MCDSVFPNKFPDYTILVFPERKTNSILSTKVTTFIVRMSIIILGVHVTVQ